MKPYVLGRQLAFREIEVDDAEFVFSLRTDPSLNKYLSPPPENVEQQRSYIGTYRTSSTDFYFIIMDRIAGRLGTVRIYDIQGTSFCWGSWILHSDAPKGAGIESALLVYDFAFFSLHYLESHFDVRRANSRVVDFHTRLGATIVRQDELNIFFQYDREQYLDIRPKYSRYLP